MKKILPIALVALILLLFVACRDMSSDINGGSNVPTGKPSNNVTEKNTDSINDVPASYLLQTYSLTDEYGNAGTYSEINKHYNAGDTVELEASVNPGYNFVGWYINDTCLSENLKYTYTMKSSSTKIEAKYDYYTVRTFSKSDDYEKAGTYTQLKNKKVSIGEQVIVEATVNAGYNFEGWYIVDAFNDVCVSKDLTYSFTMKNKNVNLEARWSYYTVTVESWSNEQGSAGTFTVKNNEKVSVGETVTLTATVENGYNFEGWYVNDICVNKDLMYSFTMKNENVYLEARWSYYTVTTESWSDEQGTIGTYSKKDGEKVSAGEIVTLTATVADGCNFEGWYINGVCVCSDLIYQFVMDKTNKTICAEYSFYTFSSYGIIAKSGWLSSTPIENIIGTCTIYRDEKISEGEVIELRATVCDEYTFEGWYLGDICVSTDMEYTYTMTKENVAIEARYTYYTLTVYAKIGQTGDMYFNDDIGYVTIYDCEKVQAGKTIILTATAKDGYRFIGWTHGHGGIIVSTSNTYTFVMKSEDDTYVAVFEEI